MDFAHFSVIIVDQAYTIACIPGLDIDFLIQFATESLFVNSRAGLTGRGIERLNMSPNSHAPLCSQASFTLSLTSAVLE